MPNLETQLTRREILEGIAAVMPSVPAIINTFSQDRIVTYQEALNDKENRDGLRQKYLEQLVRNSPYGQYIDRVIYDNDFSQAIKATTDLNTVWNNPKLLSETLSDYLYLKNSSYYSLDSRTKSERRNQFLNSAENRSTFNRYLTERNKGLIEFVKTRSALIDPPQFGIKGKSTLYVFGNSFEPVTLYGPKGQITVRPSETRLYSTVAHEGTHAEDEFKGIKGLGVPAITNSNYLNIHPEVFGFVKEIRGYLNGIEKATQLEMPNKINLLSNNFEKLPPAYLLAVISLHRYIAEKEKILVPQKLSLEDKAYVIDQLLDIKKRAPEMLGQSDVYRFFKNFGVV